MALYCFPPNYILFICAMPGNTIANAMGVPKDVQKQCQEFIPPRVIVHRFHQENIRVWFAAQPKVASFWYPPLQPHPNIYCLVVLFPWYQQPVSPDIPSRFCGWSKLNLHILPCINRPIPLRIWHDRLHPRCPRVAWAAPKRPSGQTVSKVAAMGISPKMWIFHGEHWTWYLMGGIPWVKWWGNVDMMLWKMGLNEELMIFHLCQMGVSENEVYPKTKTLDVGVHDFQTIHMMLGLKQTHTGKL